MIVPISDRARKWGYVIWPKTADEEMHALLGDLESLGVSFQGTDIGNKKVDWKRRRISVGPNQTRKLPETVKSFVLEIHKAQLSVICR